MTLLATPFIPVAGITVTPAVMLKGCPVGGQAVAIIGTGATAVQCVPHVGVLRNNFMFFSVRRRPSTSEITKRQTLTG